MITLSAPSCATTQVPTIGSNVAGGLPTVSLLQIDLDVGGAAAARSASDAADERDRCRRDRLHACLLRTRNAAGHDQRRPDAVEHRRRALRRHRQRMAAEDVVVVFGGGVDAGERRRSSRARLRPSSRGSSRAGRRGRTRSRRSAAPVCSKRPIDVAETYWTCSVGITRRSFDERLALEIDAARILGRQMHLDAQRRADLLERLLRPPPGTSSRGSPTSPSSASANAARDDRRRRRRAPSATDS